MSAIDPETLRLGEDARREKNWKRWGPYLAERQWGTVREDYSANGACWDYFPHDHAHSRAYRWGEDGLLGICDRECRLCFALALWNGRDPILKERLFGLTNEEGNHGEDVKEEYFYVDATPTSSYLKGLYKYPQRAYPYGRLVAENRRRGRGDREYELPDTGVFDEDRYWDIWAEYAKADADDIHIRLTVHNRGPEVASLHLLPTIWFRNTWIWGCRHQGCTLKPSIEQIEPQLLGLEHETLGRFRFWWDATPDGQVPAALFTENETNKRRLFGVDAYTPYVKDAFSHYVIEGEKAAVNPAQRGTKAGVLYLLTLDPGQQAEIKLRLFAEGSANPTNETTFDYLFTTRQAEAESFYQERISPELSVDEKRIARQAYAGLLWSKQFYHYVLEDWLTGDLDEPPPLPQRQHGRNCDWIHLYCHDILSMPDKWEYPWFAAWDLAFHTVAFACVDPEFAKRQLTLFLREWYLHPNGQLPAYEFALGDVNPPVHAWACWRVYKMTGPRGKRDRAFLESCFHKLLLNFTWWVNRKDRTGKHLFSGGFLGLDNIGVFDRSKPLPGGGYLQQADGTAWMAFYCGTMLSIALELAVENPVYEDMASKFFEHYIAITDAMNGLGGTGLWDEHDGFYYDHLSLDGQTIPLKVRSLVGLIPLCTVEVLEQKTVDKLKGFKKRMQWFLRYRGDLAQHISYLDSNQPGDPQARLLLAIPSRERLTRLLQRVFDKAEFLSPYGIRSLSCVYRDRPYTQTIQGNVYTVGYEPAESNSGLFGGNSNWRGPVWFPLNYLLVEALQRYHHFYGDSLKCEYPSGSGNMMTLDAIARDLARRLTRLYQADSEGRRPYWGPRAQAYQRLHGDDLLLFHEYFHGDTGEGLGASHQTGWSALVVHCLEDLACQPD